MDNDSSDSPSDAETIEAIRESLQSIERGEGIPLDEALRSLREKYGIDPRDDDTDC